MFEIERANDNELLRSAQNRVPGVGEYAIANIQDAFYEGTTTGPGVIENQIEKEERKEYGIDQSLERFDREAYQREREKLPVMNEEEWKASDHYRPNMKFREGITPVRAKIEAEYYDESMYRKSLIERGGGSAGRTILGFGAQMIGSLPDPINLIPFEGVAVKGMQAVKAARGVSGAGNALRAATSAARNTVTRTTGEAIVGGAIDGAVGNLAAAAVTKPYFDDRGIESTWQDYVNEVMVGGALGVGMSGVGRYFELKGIRKRLSIKDRDAIARQFEKDSLDLSEKGHITDEKVEGFEEAKVNIMKLQSVQNSQQLKNLKQKLIESGNTEIEADNNLLPIIAHTETYSKYYGMDFDTFLKDKVLKDINQGHVKSAEVLKGDPDNVLLRNDSINGYINGRTYEDGVRVSTVEIGEEYRGQGKGKQLYKEFIEELNGRPLYSDETLEIEAARVYESLGKEKGYTVERNPKAKENGGIIFAPEGEYVFKVTRNIDPKKEISDLIDSEIENMALEIEQSTPGQRSSVQVLNQSENEGYLKRVDTSQKSTFPEYYSRMKVKNKAHFNKVIQSKKGPIYKRIVEEAERRLTEGYSTLQGGENMPNNKFRKLKGLEEIHIDENGKRGEKAKVIQFDGNEGILETSDGQQVYFDSESISQDRIEPIEVGKQVYVSINRDPEFSTAETLFQFAGPNSNGYDAIKLNRAVELESQGRSIDEIRQETGWFKGKDGGWRYEIDDSNARFKEMDLNKNKNYKLDEVLEHESLFQAYPELKEMNVQFASSRGRKLGHYDAKTNTIKVMIDTEAVYGAKGNKILERQREIAQTPEYKKFEEGKGRLSALREFLETENGKEWQRNTLEMRRQKPKRKYPKDINKQKEAMKTILHEVQHSIQTAEKYARGGNSRADGGFSNYRNLHGEIEARDVEARMDMDANQRASTTPEILKAKSPIIKFRGEERPVDIRPDIAPGTQMTLFQNQQGPRGFVKHYEDGKNIITLLSNADRSTFLHETGHIFLRNLQDLANDRNAPSHIRRDFQTVLEWVGSKDGKINQAQNEKFARGFENYLREGIAPNNALAQAFEMFKEWLTRIYQSSEDLKADLTPEIRGVYDNLLGADRYVFEPEKIISEMDNTFVRRNDVDQAAIDEMHEAAANGELSETDMKIYQQTQEVAEIYDNQLKSIEEVEEAMVLFQNNPEELLDYLEEELKIPREDIERIIEQIEADSKLSENLIVKEKFSAFQKRLIEEQITDKKSLLNLKKGISEKGLLSREFSKTIREVVGNLNHFNPIMKKKIKDTIVDWATLHGKNLTLNELDLAVQFHEAKIINKRMKKELEDSAFSAQKRATLTVMAKNKITTDINKMIDGGANPIQAILSLLEGRASLKHIEGSGASVDAKKLAVETMYTNQIEDAIDQINPAIYKRFEEDPAFNESIIDEFWNLDKDGSKSSTGDNEAFLMAKKLKELADDVRERLNVAGSDVGYLKDWAPQSHSTDKISAVGRWKWKEYILDNDLLDLRRTFGVESITAQNRPYVESQLDLIFNKLVLGSVEDLSDEVHFLDPVELMQVNMKNDVGQVPANVAKRHNHSRTLFFKGSKEQKNYNANFGESNILVGIHDYLQRGSRTLALIEKFGSNPEFTLSIVMDEIRQKVIDGEMLSNLNDIEKEKLLNNLPNRMELANRDKAIGQAFKIAMGEHLRPHNQKWANRMGVVRGIQTLSKLGAATLSQLADVTNATMERAFLRDQTIFNEFTDTLSTLWKRNDPETQKIIRKLSIITDSLLTDNLNRFSSDEGLNDAFNRASNFMFKINGMKWFTNKMKAGHALAVTSDLADNITKPFSELPKGYQMTLKQYGKINELSWDIIRKAPLDEANGNKFITPESIRDIPEEEIEILIPDKFHFDNKPHGRDLQKIDIWSATRSEMIKRKKKELELNYRMFLVETTRNAILEPDARTARFTTLGLNRGTVAGEVMRTFMQFKSFAFTQAHRSLGSRRMQRVGYGYDVKNVAQYAATSIALGYLSMSLKDISKGREPKDFRNKSVIMESIAQSGGLGIVGDIFVNSTNRYGGSAVGTLMGPTVGAIDSAFDIWGRFKDMAIEDTSDNHLRNTGGAAVRAIQTNLPFSSLWYTREAMNHLIWYHLKEMASPGYLKRTERMLKKKNEQDLLLSPAKVWGY